MSYYLGERSKESLKLVHPNLVKVAELAINYFDFTVIEGHRSVERQQELFAQGRTRPGEIVTNVDGVRVRGKHNLNPAKAIDCVPYPLDWSNEHAFRHMAMVMLGCASYLGVPLTWGGSWRKIKDLPHFELP